MLSPKVYIVIVNFRQWMETRDCLESVLRSTYRNYNVFVIDNNSGNNSLEYLAEWLGGRDNETKARIGYTLGHRKEFSGIKQLPPVVLIQNDENRGFAAGNNVALRLMRDEDAYFWLLNPDMIVKEDTLENLVRCAVSSPGKNIIGTAVHSFAGNQDLLFYGGHRVNFLSATVSMVRHPGEASRLDYISGASLFSHASMLKEIGLMPEEYFLYWEETDWCYRARQANYRLTVCANAVCYDKISTIIGKSFMSDYYYARNGLRFMSKYRKRNIPFVLFFMGIRFGKRVITGQWPRARGVFRGTIDYFKLKPDVGQ